ncbi:MAG: HEAT repeat domain-containing protein [Phycisphaerales bacterium]|nr:MAG: HEAT repeat domain-containing protein [Phycisphaerales bacterium]
MNSERVFYRRRDFLGLRSVGMGAIVFVLVLVGSVLASTGTESGTLQDLYEQARQLAQTPEGRAEAMAQYHRIIEIHRANARTYEAALRQLAKGYGEAEQVEEGTRFFIGLAQETWNVQRSDPLREILNQLRLKYPEQVDQVIAEMQSSRSRTRSVPPVAAQDLAQAILQRDDPLLREKGLERLAAMLAESASDADKQKGLATLRSALTAKFDRAPFRDLVLPLLASDDAQVRALALQCLPGLEATADDLPVLIPLAQDASAQVRERVGGALIQLGKGERGEIVIPALMQLLKDEESKVVEQTIRSMWGQYAAPDFDALLIELSYEQKYHHNVIYFCLSTMRSKSPAVCRRLVEVLAEPDWNDSGRAAWGLTYGVTEEAKALVEEGLLKALPEETHDYTRQNELRALARVATEKSRPYLTSVVESDMETDETRDAARRILAALDRQQGR